MTWRVKNLQPDLSNLNCLPILKHSICWRRCHAKPEKPGKILGGIGQLRRIEFMDQNGGSSCLFEGPVARGMIWMSVRVDKVLDLQVKLINNS